jgi:predicted PurR-regulated permease PerM
MHQLPATVKRSIELLGIILLGIIVMYGSDIIMPLLLAFLLSIVLLPVYRFLKARKMPELLAISLSLLLLILMLAGVIWFFSYQISKLVADYPAIRANITVHLNAFSNWIDQKTHFTTSQQIQLINEQGNELLAQAGNLLGGAAGSVTTMLAYIGLVPIYIFLILFYKNLLLRFVFLWFDPADHQNVEDVLRETEVIIKSYLIGLMIQITYITVLLGGILYFIGIEHALLIGIIFAFLNLIPYVGALIGNIIGVLLTVSSTQELWPIIWVLGTIAFVQFLDNNILMPRIVGSKVRINALSTIVGVIVGGKLAGIAGMFLSLPVLAMLKVIFDRSPNFKQWGVLFGDEVPPVSPMNFPLLRRGADRVRRMLERHNKIEPPHA